MNPADVQSLVNLLSNNQADPTLFPELYDDAINSLNGGWHTTAVPVTFTENATLVNLPPTLLNLLILIYDDQVLSRLGLREMESLRRGWRNVHGTPVAYTLESETAKTVEVFPTPLTTSPPIIPVHGLPTGLDYQPGNGISIHVENRQNALPILTIPLALMVLSREYVRESDHRDMAFAALCQEAAMMLLKMLETA